MITKEIARTLTHGTILYHARLKNADGSPTRARVNGKLQEKVRAPEHWQLPMKHGLKTCFYITPLVAHEWCTTEAGTVIEGNLPEDAKSDAWCQNCQTVVKPEDSEITDFPRCPHCWHGVKQYDEAAIK